MEQLKTRQMPPPGQDCAESARAAPRDENKEPEEAGWLLVRKAPPPQSDPGLVDPVQRGRAAGLEENTIGGAFNIQLVAGDDEGSSSSGSDSCSEDEEEDYYTSLIT